MIGGGGHVGRRIVVVEESTDHGSVMSDIRWQVINPAILLGKRHGGSGLLTADLSSGGGIGMHERYRSFVVTMAVGTEVINPTDEIGIHGAGGCR
jgi:hypothetical protein